VGRRIIEEAEGSTHANVLVKLPASERVLWPTRGIAVSISLVGHKLQEGDTELMHRKGWDVDKNDGAKKFHSCCWCSTGGCIGQQFLQHLVYCTIGDGQRGRLHGRYLHQLVLFDYWKLFEGV